MRILLAEDDTLLGDGLRAGLRQHGFQVDWVRDGAAAERELRAQPYAAAVLDLGLPLMDGLDVLGATRAAGVTLPVLVLTARDAVPDRIRGLDLGADDYVIKPVDLDELAARLRALVRLNPAARLVTRNGAVVALSTRECGWPPPPSPGKTPAMSLTSCWTATWPKPPRCWWPNKRMTRAPKTTPLKPRSCTATGRRWRFRYGMKAGWPCARHKRRGADGGLGRNARPHGPGWPRQPAAPGRA